MMTMIFVCVEKSHALADDFLLPSDNNGADVHG
jgi:hypothetical protein